HLIKYNDTLIKINLSRNCDASSINLILNELPTNNTLQRVNLSYTKISNDHVECLQKILRLNFSIKNLILIGNDIDYNGLALLVESLKDNCTLTKLDIRFNNSSYYHKNFV